MQGRGLRPSAADDNNQTASGNRSHHARSPPLRRGVILIYPHLGAKRPYNRPQPKVTSLVSDRQGADIARHSAAGSAGRDGLAVEREHRAHLAAAADR